MNGDFYVIVIVLIFILTATAFWLDGLNRRARAAAEAVYDGVFGFFETLRWGMSREEALVCVGVFDVESHAGEGEGAHRVLMKPHESIAELKLYFGADDGLESVELLTGSATGQNDLFSLLSRMHGTPLTAEGEGEVVWELEGSWLSYVPAEKKGALLRFSAKGA